MVVQFWSTTIEFMHGVSYITRLKTKVVRSSTRNKPAPQQEAEPEQA